MKSTLMTRTPAAGLSCGAAPVTFGIGALIAPFAAAQGTGLSLAGTYAAAAAPVAPAVVHDVRNTDLPGLHPRGAPV